MDAPPELRSAWTRWVSAIDDAAHGRRSWRRVTAREYQEVYGALIEASKHWSVQGDAELARVAGEMHRLAAPWKSSDIVSHTERPLLLDLFRKCCGVKGAGIHRSQVAGRRNRSTLRIGMLAIIAGMLVGVGLLFWFESGGWGSISYDVRRFWWSLQRNVAGTGRQTFYFITVVLVACSVALAYTTRRS